MRTLGAVLAGGASRRFGSDKAAALYQGRPLLEHALAALTPLCDVCVIVGRDSPRATSIPDWPAPGMGPLGGIAGALRHADGFDQVLSVPVDCLDLPAELLAALTPSPAFLADQPVIGLWPLAARAPLAALLAADTRHSMRAFAEAIGARPVAGLAGARNINTPADLARLTGTA